MSTLFAPTAPLCLNEWLLCHSPPIARFGITFNGSVIPWVEHLSEQNARKAIDWMARMLGCSPACFAVVVGHCGECHETACLCEEPS